MYVQCVPFAYVHMCEVYENRSETLRCLFQRCIICIVESDGWARRRSPCLSCKSLDTNVDVACSRLELWFESAEA